MAAPDYVSQVRGVINDLRENYLQKQQLFQRQQEAAASNALGYAQLQASRDNANLNRDLQDRQLEFSYLQEANRAQQAQEKLDADQRAQQYNLFKDQIGQDLAERKYQLDSYKEARSAQKEAIDALGKRQASERLAEFAKLAANKDYAGMNQWYSDAQKDTVDSLEFGSMINQASQIAAGIEKTNNLQTVEVVRPEIEQFSRDAGVLSSTLQKYSLPDRAQRISSLKTRGNELLTLVKDQDMRDTINGVLSGIDLREKELEKQKSSEQIDSFVGLGEDNKLAEVDPTIQQKFDDLYATTPVEERGTEDFNRERRRLMLNYNLKKSDNEIKRAAAELAAYEIAQTENPDYTITNPDGSVSPKFPAPDLTLSFASGTLDRDNNISEGLQSEIDKFRQQMRTAGVAKPRQDDLAGIANIVSLARGGKPISKPGAAEEPKAPQKVVRFSNTALLPSPQSGQPVEAPTQAPSATAPAVPQADTKNYRMNEALLNEVDRQLKAGNKVYVENGKPTNINLTSLRNRIVSRMGQQQVTTFSPRTRNLVEESMTPAGMSEPTE